MLLFLSMYQKQSFLEFKMKDLKLFTSISRLPKLLEQLSEKYDTSPLAKILITTALNDKDLDLDLVSPILKSLMQGQLKTTYLLV